MRWRWAAFLCVLLVLGVSFERAAGHFPHAVNPNALWTIVHSQCVPEKREHGDPKPCTTVDLSAGEANGYAVLKDIVGVAQYLLIPTVKITGIESPALLGSSGPNYWQAAWAARHFMTASLHKSIPDDDVGLAINSREGRSQNQLHIHIDCIRLDVKQALIHSQLAITKTWFPLPVPLAGHEYRVMRLNSTDLAGLDLFHLLAESDPQAGSNMAAQTLAAVGAMFSDGSRGFYLLNDHAERARHDNASSEEILDHDCAIVR